MTNQIEKITWDSCAIIDFLQKAGEYSFLQPLESLALKKELIVVVSSAAMAECVYVEGVLKHDQEKVIDEFFERSWVHVEAAGLSITRLARDIRRSHSIGGMDSIHIATALWTGCSVLLTVDGSGKRKKVLSHDGKISYRHNGPLAIRTPEQHQKAQLAGTLFECDPTIHEKTVTVTDVASDPDWLIRMSKTRQLIARDPSRFGHQRPLRRK